MKWRLHSTIARQKPKRRMGHQKGAIMNQMSYPQLLDEIERVNIAIAVSKSDHLKTDYKKYLRKLYKEMHNYERFMKIV